MSEKRDVIFIYNQIIVCFSDGNRLEFAYSINRPFFQTDNRVKINYFTLLMVIL